MTSIDLFTRARTPATLAACIALLAACSRHAPAAAPHPATPAASAAGAAAGAALPSPRPLDKKQGEAVMRTLFGAAYDAAQHSAQATITVDGAEHDVVMSLVAAATLPDGRVGAVVNGMPDGASQPDAGILNVYVLRHSGNAWTVAARHEGVDELGTNGQLGSARWVMLGAGKPGFIVSSGGLWQGYSISSADIYELGSQVRGMGGFQEGSSNSGACTPALDACWDVDGDIRVAAEAQPGGYHDLLVDFKGKRYTVSEGRDGKEVEHLKSTVRQTARYRFDGKSYVLKAGTNPVPAV